MVDLMVNHRDQFSAIGFFLYFQVPSSTGPWQPFTPAWKDVLQFRGWFFFFWSFLHLVGIELSSGLSATLSGDSVHPFYRVILAEVFDDAALALVGVDRNLFAQRYDLLNQQSEKQKDFFGIAAPHELAVGM
jgi:hypothetical protein